MKILGLLNMFFFTALVTNTIEISCYQILILQLYSWILICLQSLADISFSPISDLFRPHIQCLLLPNQTYDLSLYSLYNFYYHFWRYWALTQCYILGLLLCWICIYYINFWFYNFVFHKLFCNLSKNQMNPSLPPPAAFFLFFSSCYSFFLFL
jgi:hypothetical protein